MDRHGQNGEISDLWVCLLSERAQARETQAFLTVGKIVSRISRSGFGRGDGLCRMEADLMGLWVTAVVMVGSTVFTPPVVLTTVPAMLLVLVVATDFCIGPTITRIILRTGPHLRFPSVSALMPRPSKWCRRFHAGE